MFKELFPRDCPQPIFFYERISDLLIVANSSLNFIVYCFCSRRFRQILIQLVCRRDVTKSVKDGLSISRRQQRLGAALQLEGVVSSHAVGGAMTSHAEGRTVVELKARGDMESRVLVKEEWTEMGAINGEKSGGDRDYV